MPPFIDVHTHKTDLAPIDVLQVSNVIVSKDYIVPTPCSVGIHPWYIDQDMELQLEALEKYAQKPQSLAIGECGLDKMHGPDLKKQIEAFCKQIELANAVNKPLIIHCVRSYQEIFDLLRKKSVNVPVIFHGYNKVKPDLANSILHQGYYISFGTDIIKGRLDAVLRRVPMDRIFFETDDKSISIIDIYTYFCGIRNLSITSLKQQVADNFSAVFNCNF